MQASHTHTHTQLLKLLWVSVTFFCHHSPCPGCDRRCPGAALALPWRCPELFDWQEYAGPTDIFHVLFQTRTRTFSALDSHCGIQSRAVPASSRKSGLSPRASVRIQYVHVSPIFDAKLSVCCMEADSMNRASSLPVQLYIYRTLSLRRVIYGYSCTFVPYRISVSAS